MPTGPNNDLVPVRKATKADLALAKGSASFDEAIRALLDEVPPETLRARLAARRATRDYEAWAAERADAADEPVDGRTASKQILIAKLAEEGWKRWRRDGVVERLGPRRYRYVPQEPSPEVIRIVRKADR